jgi:hypothetical protein
MRRALRAESCSGSFDPCLCGVREEKKKTPSEERS